MKLTKLFLIAALFACCAVLPLATGAQIPSPRDVVAPTIYLSADPVGRGSSIQLALVVKIREGFHMNAREKSADYLIAPDLKVDAPAGFKVGSVSYPKGTLQNFTFSKTPLNVYHGTVILRVPLAVLADAPLGAQRIPLKFRYQACSTEVCLPPVTLNLDAGVKVASSTAETKAAHPEIFSAQ